MVALGVKLVGELQHLGRAESDAKAASLAAAGIEIDDSLDLFGLLRRFGNLWGSLSFVPHQSSFPL
jgi:hypothetical protein